MAETNDWKSDATDPVLRLLYEAGVGISPGGIAATLREFVDAPPSESAVRRALAALEDRDMVRELHETGGYYLLTPHGRDYVKREFGDEAFGFVE